MRGAGAGEVAVERGDSPDAGAAAGGEREDFVAGMNGAGGDLAGEAAEVLVRADDALDGQPEGCVVLRSMASGRVSRSSRRLGPV